MNEEAGNHDNFYSSEIGKSLILFMVVNRCDGL